MRSLTTAAATAATAEIVSRTVAVELMFASGASRMCAAPVDLSFGGNTYLGVGGFGSISTVEEGADLQAYRLTVQLSGIPRDLIAAALQDNYRGLPGTVWEVMLDANGVPVADPIVLFRGRMDTMTVQMGQTATVAVQLENKMSDWQRAKIRRYSPEDQEAVYPDDLGFRFAASVANMEIIWPERGWFEAHK